MMAIKLASLNVRGLRDRDKTVHLLCDLLSFGVDVAVIQQTHCVCDIDSRELSGDSVVYSAYRDQQAKGISLLVKRSIQYEGRPCPCGYLTLRILTSLNLCSKSKHFLKFD